MHAHTLTLLDGSHSEQEPNFFLSSSASSSPHPYSAPLIPQFLHLEMG